MKYCIFSYAVHYNNRKIKSALAPYRGEDLDDTSLAAFVQEYFSGAPDSYHAIEVRIENVFEDEEAWINGILDLDAFKFLRKVERYAQDSIDKYM